MPSSKNPPPVLSPYANRRSREHLTPGEVSPVIDAADHGRYALRNALMIRMMYRHALRVSEAVALKWEQLNLPEQVFHVLRLKGGVNTTHPLCDPEIDLLRKLWELRDPDNPSPYVFLSNRGRPLTPSMVRKIVARAGEQAGLPFPIHPHMLRHSCGYVLASKGVDTRAIQLYMGHVNIQNTTKYTALSPRRFVGLWEDAPGTHEDSPADLQKSQFCCKILEQILQKEPGITTTCVPIPVFNYFREKSPLSRGFSAAPHSKNPPSASDTEPKVVVRDAVGRLLEREPSQKVLKIVLDADRLADVLFPVLAQFLDLVVMAVKEGVRVPDVDQVGNKTRGTAAVDEVAEEAFGGVVVERGLGNVCADGTGFVFDDGFEFAEEGGRVR